MDANTRHLITSTGFELKTLLALLPFSCRTLQGGNIQALFMTSEISNQIEKLKESFLLAAATGGRLLECQSLLELGAEIDYANDVDDKDTPLLAACRGGHRAVVSLLLVSRFWLVRSLILVCVLVFSDKILH